MSFLINLKDLKISAIKDCVENHIEPKEANVEVGILIEHVFGVKAKDIILNSEQETSESKIKEFNFLVRKRTREKIPVQYLTKKAYFMGEEFYVDENVLIPRPETEILVEEVVRRCNNGAKIIDIGTGSGCIAVMTAKMLPEASVFASDISDKALSVARYNAEKLNVREKITFIHSDIFNNIDISKKFDVIVSNPPYISISEKEELQIEVNKYEPHLALFVEDEEGVSFYEKLAVQSKTRLNQPGLLIVEVGASQAGLVKGIFKANGFKDIEITKDMSGIDRIVSGKI